MHVHYVTTSTDSLASFRMRIKIPAEKLTENVTRFSYSIDEMIDPKASVNVFSKHFNKDQDLKAITKLKEQHPEVLRVFDICDDYFDKNHGPYYIEMCQLADVITCNSLNMQTRIKEVTGKDATVVGDPFTFPLIAPTDPEKVEFPQLIWYGNRANLGSILSRVNELPNITILSNSQPTTLPPHVRYRTWFKGVVESALWKHHIVVLPRIEGEEATRKSCNRAIDALRAGAFVVSDFPEVFEPLKDYIFLGDLKDGIEFYKDHPDAVLRMITQGQEYVTETYSPEQIAKTWEKVFLQNDRK